MEALVQKNWRDVYQVIASGNSALQDAKSKVVCYMWSPVLESTLWIDSAFDGRQKSRVVVLSSAAERIGEMDFIDLNYKGSRGGASKTF